MNGVNQTHFVHPVRDVMTDKSSSSTTTTSTGPEQGSGCKRDEKYFKFSSFFEDLE